MSWLWIGVYRVGIIVSRLGLSGSTGLPLIKISTFWKLQKASQQSKKIKIMDSHYAEFQSGYVNDAFRYHHD